VGFRHRRIHHLLVHASVGGQFDDVAVRVAKIDRPTEAVVDRSAHFDSRRPPLIEHAVEHVVVDGERDVQIEVVLSLEIERLVRRLEEGKAGTVITLRVKRPIEVVVLNCCVTETKDAPLASRISTILAKSASERVSRSIL
jgi:hypothetical protein